MTRASIIYITAALLVCLTFVTAYAELIEPQSVEIVQGKSTVVINKNPARRVSIANPETADIVLISPTQVYITGKKAGITNLTLWDRAGNISNVMDVRVTPDVTHLKEMLHRVLPGENDIRVISTGEHITLSGTVSSAANLSTAVEVAELYAPEKVTNLMGVGGVHQVMLEVKVAEMQRSVLERFGIDLQYYWNGDFAFSLLNNLFQLDNQNGPLPLASGNAISNGGVSQGNMAINGARNGMFRLSSGQATFTGFLDVLKSNGLVKVLAEPTLICRSGEDAQFLAGGEIPIPVPQGLGTVAIEYKKYGVSLLFSPTVLSGDRISLKVFPEVSELDYTNALQISSYTIPALTSRHASTVVELASGQSFAIAGLLQDHVRETIDKYPVLGDVPVLGALFRSSEFQKSETELVIIVTPHLAKPLPPNQIALPTDKYIEPTELEFFFHGKMEGAAPKEVARIKPASFGSANGNEPAAGMEGNFGHILPAQ